MRRALGLIIAASLLALSKRAEYHELLDTCRRLNADLERDRKRHRTNGEMLHPDDRATLPEWGSAGP